MRELSPEDKAALNARVDDIVETAIVFIEDDLSKMGKPITDDTKVSLTKLLKDYASKAEVFYSSKQAEGKTELDASVTAFEGKLQELGFGSHAINELRAESIKQITAATKHALIGREIE